MKTRMTADQAKRPPARALELNLSELRTIVAASGGTAERQPDAEAIVAASIAASATQAETPAPATAEIQPSKVQGEADPGKGAPSASKIEVKSADKPESLVKDKVDKTFEISREGVKPAAAKGELPKSGGEDKGKATPAKSSTDINVNLKTTHWVSEKKVWKDDRVEGDWSNHRSGEAKVVGTLGVGYTDGKFGPKAEIEAVVSGKVEITEHLGKHVVMEHEQAANAKAAAGLAAQVGADGLTGKFKIGTEADYKSQFLFMHKTGGADVGGGIKAEARATAEAGAEATVGGGKVKVGAGYEAGASISAEALGKLKDHGSENSLQIGAGAHAGAKAGFKAAIDTDEKGNPKVSTSFKLVGGVGGSVSVEAKLDTKPMRETLKSIDRDMSDRNSHLSKT